jgi:hypothetical protein
MGLKIAPPTEQQTTHNAQLCVLLPIIKVTKHEHLNFDIFD